MNGRSVVLLCFAAGFLLAREGRAEDCGRGTSPQFSYGRDARGYFVRPLVREAYSGHSAKGVEKSASFVGVAEYLAEAAGTAVLLFGTLTNRDVEPGEWRGDEPLTVLKAFAVDAGLRVETPRKDLWVIGHPKAVEQAAATVFARPLDSTQAKYVSQAETAEVERALISQLPVRGASGAPEMYYLGASYYWLTPEGRDVLFVQGNCLFGGSRSGGPAQYQAFKIRLNRSSGKVAVECIWHTDEAPGWLIPEIAEDFDGDGYRDFVFAGGDYSPSVILSGKDGHRLLSFAGELSVEKAVAGPKRVAVEMLWDDLSSASESDPSPVLPRLLSFSEATRMFALTSPPLGAAAPVASTNPPTTDARHLLATAVGGPDRVRTFVSSLNTIKSSKGGKPARRDVELVLVSNPQEGAPNEFSIRDPLVHVLFVHKPDASATVR